MKPYTLKVTPTDAGDRRYFVVTRRSDGSTLVDARPWSRLTRCQRSMAVLKTLKQAA